MCWCRTRRTTKLDRHLFNEAYLMHTSTSPQYSIIASCDVAAAMMEPPGGTALVEESIGGAGLPPRHAQGRRRIRRRLVVQGLGPGKAGGRGHRPRRRLDHPSDAKGKKGSKWHGFGKLADGFNMLDPIKSTIVTPGLTWTASSTRPASRQSIVTKFLAEHGVVVEKTGLYSFFIMFTIGITKGRWNTLLTALQQFKDDYEKNQPMWRILPEFCQQHRQYERMGLRDLCQHVHELYAKYDIARLTTEMYLST
jgi:arginine decarboxylase